METRTEQIQDILGSLGLGENVMIGVEAEYSFTHNESDYLEDDDFENLTSQ